MLQQGSESRAKCGAISVRLLYQPGDLVAEREAFDRAAQSLRWIVRNRHLTYWPARDGCGIEIAHGQLDRLMRRVERPALVDLGEIVVLGRQPEDWDRRYAAR